MIMSRPFRSHRPKTLSASHWRCRPCPWPSQLHINPPFYCITMSGRARRPRPTAENTKNTSAHPHGPPSGPFLSALISPIGSRGPEAITLCVDAAGGQVRWARDTPELSWPLHSFPRIWLPIRETRQRSPPGRRRLARTLNWIWTKTEGIVRFFICKSAEPEAMKPEGDGTEDKTLNAHMWKT